MDKLIRIFTSEEFWSGAVLMYALLMCLQFYLDRIRTRALLVSCKHQTAIRIYDRCYYLVSESDMRWHTLERAARERHLYNPSNTDKR